MRNIEFFVYSEADRDGNQIMICKAKTQYHGRNYYALAKCHPNDKFDRTTGEQLAKLRLLKKISKARLKVAMKEVLFVEDVLKRQIISAHEYLADAKRKDGVINLELKELEEKIYGKR